MASAPLLFQTRPRSVGEPFTVVTPAVLNAPVPVMLPPLRLSALFSVRSPAPVSVPPLSVSVGPPAANVMGVGRSSVPPVRFSVPAPLSVTPLKLRIPELSSSVLPSAMPKLPLSVTGVGVARSKLPRFTLKTPALLKAIA